MKNNQKLWILRYFESQVIKLKKDFRFKKSPYLNRMSKFHQKRPKKALTSRAIWQNAKMVVYISVIFTSFASMFCHLFQFLYITHSQSFDFFFKFISLNFFHIWSVKIHSFATQSHICPNKWPKTIHCGSQCLRQKWCE